MTSLTSLWSLLGQVIFILVTGIQGNPFVTTASNILSLLDDGTSLITGDRRLQEGIQINECADTFQLFGGGNAEAFKALVDCQCSGDFGSSYEMQCTVDGYCFDYEDASACVNIVYTYYFEVDEATGRLLRSGFKRQTSCSEYISGNGPSGELCRDFNPQCPIVIREEFFLTSRAAAAICNEQTFCPEFFLEFNYTQAEADRLCPTQTLNGQKCLTANAGLCGPSLDANSDASSVYISTADCSNVDACATRICREIENDSMAAIRNGEIYPNCNVDHDSLVHSSVVTTKRCWVVWFMVIVTVLL